MENTDNVKKIDLINIDWQSSREFFASLKDELEKLDDHDERYDFTWVGKRKSIVEAGAPIDKILRPDVTASKNFDDTENLLIVGDNLDALKLLIESYYGRIKMIYIDPPYNTGHDFVYRDNFRAKLADYQDDSVGEDDEILSADDEFTENSRANGRFHSDWLSMIYPRLKLARNLLSDDGVIFISIDDNEQANLKKVCDEVFGEENFVGCLVWKTKTAAKGVPTTNMLVNNHDYVFCYEQQKGNFRFRGEDRDESQFGNPDNDPRGAWKADNMKSTISQKIFTITMPETGWQFTKNWAFSKESVQKMIEENRIIWPSTPDGTPRQKRFKSEYLNDTTPIRTLIGEWQSETATNKLKELFDDRKFFDFPKPLGLIELLIKQATKNNDTILDFFAGSGTTAHAVMDLNAEDGGQRKFILVQLDESTADKSEAKKAGYETIDQITAERIRRAGDKIAKEHPDAKIDAGFRVLRVDATNEKGGLRKVLNDYTQENLLGMVENLRPDRTPLDLLFGTIYVLKLPFDEKLETRQIGENTIYLYGYLGEDSGLVACFDDEIPESTIREITKLKPLVVAFKDQTFRNSADKINLSEIFRVLAPETKVKVV